MTPEQIWQYATRIDNSHILRAFEVAAVGQHPVCIVAADDTEGQALHDAGVLALGLQIDLLRPCPCGYWSSDRVECLCAEAKLRKYAAGMTRRAQKSDIIVEACATAFGTFVMVGDKGEPLDRIMSRVEAAKAVDPSACDTADIGPVTLGLLESAYDQFKWTPRVLLRCLRVADSIRRLDGVDEIGVVHVAEACQYQQDPFRKCRW